MSQSKYHASTPLTADVQPSNARETEDWQDDMDTIQSILASAARPLTAREIQLQAFLSKPQTRRRLDDLLDSNQVIKRNDGPDGRRIYYELSGRTHHSDGEYWHARPIRKP